MGSALAGGDSKDSPKAKRAYPLGYGYAPIVYNHDTINHAPIHTTYVHHAPAIATVAHAPVVAHTPYVAHAPIVSAIAPVSKVTSSVVSTNVHHYPSYTNYPASYFAPHAAPLISSAAYYHQAPALVAPTYAHSPLFTEFHRR